MEIVSNSWSKEPASDYSEWGMPAHMVNAYQSTEEPDCLPGGYFTSTFYDCTQSSSANYGIGAVIAHEISHALDTNGAFDENGSSKDW